MASTETASRASTLPVVALALAAFAALAALALAALGGSAPRIVPTAIGYVLGATVSVVFASLYRASKAKRPRSTFRENPTLDTIVTVLLVLAVLSGMGCAYFLATEIAKW